MQHLTYEQTFQCKYFASGLMTTMTWKGAILNYHWHIGLQTDPNMYFHMEMKDETHAQYSKDAMHLCAVKEQLNTISNEAENIRNSSILILMKLKISNSFYLLLSIKTINCQEDAKVINYMETKTSACLQMSNSKDWKFKAWPTHKFTL